MAFIPTKIRTRHYHAACRSPFSRRYSRHRWPGRSRHSTGPQIEIPTRKRTHNSDALPPSSTRWELLTGWTDPVVNDPPDETRTRVCAAGSASSTIGVAVAVATTTIAAATTPSGASESRLAFPVPPVISNSYEMIIVISGRRKNRPRNRTQPLRLFSRQWRAWRGEGRRMRLHAPARTRHPAVHRGGAPARMGRLCTVAPS